MKNSTVATLWFIAFIIHFTLSALCWPYVINSILIWIGKSTVILWWHGILIGCIPIINRYAVTLAIFVLILNLFV